MFEILLKACCVVTAKQGSYDSTFRRQPTAFKLAPFHYQVGIIGHVYEAEAKNKSLPCQMLFGIPLTAYQQMGYLMFPIAPRKGGKSVHHMTRLKKLLRTNQ